MKKVSNIMLIVICIAIISYTIAAFALQFFTTVEISPTLTTVYYTFWTAEIIALTTIKNNKTKYSTKEENELAEV